MMAGKLLLCAVTAVSLAGCVTGEQEKAIALKQAQDHCTSEGKQFVLKNATANTHFNVITQSADAEVEGTCVGPGDPGYVAPAPANPGV